MNCRLKLHQPRTTLVRALNRVKSLAERRGLYNLRRLVDCVPILLTVNPAMSSR